MAVANLMMAWGLDSFSSWVWVSVGYLEIVAGSEPAGAPWR